MSVHVLRGKVPAEALKALCLVGILILVLPSLNIPRTSEVPPFVSQAVEGLFPSRLGDAGGPFPQARASESKQSQIKSRLASMPAQFIPNLGQAPDQVSYYLHGAGTSVWFTPQGLTLSLPDRTSKSPPLPESLAGPLDRLSTRGAERWVVKLDFVGGRQVQPRGSDKTSATVSYFKGPRDQWKTQIPTYSTITYHELWPGIDLQYTGEGGKLKYNFLVHPGADPGAIQLAYRGTDGLSIGKAGELAVATPTGGFIDQRPYTYQEVDGKKVEVKSAYTIQAGADSYGFKLGAYDSTLPLVIDPAILVYAGYVGGLAVDQALGIAVDASGAAYVTGETVSTQASFPDTVGPDTTSNGGSDAFVAKVRPDGSGLVYAGYIGGSGFDIGFSIAVDGSGAAYVIGTSASSEASFPVTGGPDLTNNGGADGFVAKVSPDGSGLVYAGYIGGAGDERGWGIALDASGAAFVTGQTSSNEASFPVSGGLDTTFNGGLLDAFVAKVEPDGSSLTYSGYIGGSGVDSGWDVAVDASGSAYVAGQTTSTQTSFPVTGGLDTTQNGDFDGFVAKIKPDGSSLTYAGYIGGSGFDLAFGVAVDAPGAAYVTGRTRSGSSTFPATVGPDLTLNGSDDAFVAKVNPAGSGLVYAGYIGGAAFDQGLGIAIDPSGAAYIGGQSASTQASFPVGGGPDSTYNGGVYDGFVAKVNPAGSALEQSGYIGGLAYDRVSGIALDSAGAAYVSGVTQSTQHSFPVSVGPDTTHNGDFDGFVAKISATLSTSTLSISKTCSPNPVSVAGTLTCSIKITNTGPSAAASVRVTDSLPANVTLVSAPSGGGFACSTQTSDPQIICTKASQPVSPPAASSTITYKVFVSEEAAPGGTLSNTATVSSPGFGTASTTAATTVSPCTITGTEGDDALNGTPGPDVICGLGGADSINGFGGNDTLIGGPGDDAIFGGLDNDTIIGGTGADLLRGGAGNDVIYGGGGADLIYGDAGDDTMFGRDDTDGLHGGAGVDRADGGPGADLCSAETQVSC